MGGVAWVARQQCRKGQSACWESPRLAQPRVEHGQARHLRISPGEIGMEIGAWQGVILEVVLERGADGTDGLVQMCDACKELLLAARPQGGQQGDESRLRVAFLQRPD